MTDPYTPEPWIARKFSERFIYIEARGDLQKIEQIALVCDVYGGKEAKNANAKVLAASLTLLKRLRALVAERGQCVCADGVICATCNANEIIAHVTERSEVP